MPHGLRCYCTVGLATSLSTDSLSALSLRLAYAVGRISLDISAIAGLRTLIKPKYEIELSFPGYYKLFEDLDSLSNHITYFHGLTESKELEFDESLVNAQKPLELHMPRESTENCQTNNRIIRNVISALNLIPFDVESDPTNDNQHKFTALTSATLFKRVLEFKEGDTKKLKLNTPYESTISVADCIHINDTSNNQPLNEILELSPYRQLLALESYTKIIEENIELLNAHWRKQSWMSMGVSQLLTGAFVVYGKKALLLNGVESYSRYPCIDVHFEKVQPTQESSTPDLMSQYPNMLKITKVYFDNSGKLVLGTKAFNILVISKHYGFIKWKNTTHENGSFSLHKTATIKIPPKKVHILLPDFIAFSLKSLPFNFFPFTRLIENHGIDWKFGTRGKPSIFIKRRCCSIDTKEF
ncbi:hypothetical protein PHYBLDRAFT_63259 [Phycomyces blakesleeanus NRRL 1555(-)]|uniref:Uncharacterized protein n=1 Tax=Phycomyces blakesleeanus (strain ATCC 8743b / DSM 1359 / FGSC 10004 / NBRC 33097 / NRRL 1555) TaxID=763407 RepID=A0A162UIT7_PHYB8|nr:hypothetical protein PHYBLDRAFT_63259 [Phycomyces blakesleeanus NRRL 1555(-)]OAD76532.1 hypothetical protein PHYBLDRAFT_63259 [Phycomyces blakesleeanus NRRL 1555(-)]|eukprot:XP_018294572.1 hypothetical protein PHYBLDRAFT_63259 [Phycomyces blakesleeanus NRRL 1555(-)]